MPTYAKHLIRRDLGGTLYRTYCSNEFYDPLLEILVKDIADATCRACRRSYALAMRTHSAIQRRIEEEYGEPIARVIRGFRQQGCSWRTICGALDVNFNTLRRWVREMGLGDGRYQREAPTVLDMKAQALGYTGVEAFIRSHRAAGQTLAEMASILDCNPWSLRLRTPADVKDMPRPKSDKALAAWRENARRLNERRREMA